LKKKVPIGTTLVYAKNEFITLKMLIALVVIMIVRSWLERTVNGGHSKVSMNIVKYEEKTVNPIIFRTLLLTYSLCSLVGS
jgi:hypothetical protein